MKAKGETFKSIGYQYKHPTSGIIYIEHHIDDNPLLPGLLPTSCKYGGNLSVRKRNEEKVVLILGQDESIFKQYQINNKSWTLPDGTTDLVPKSDGAGIMLSSFTSREFGYGMKISPQQLRRINEERKGKYYSDTESAKKKKGSSKKNELTSSPFVRWLEYGANLNGYWSYEDMSMQMEDFIDCLHVLHPQFHIILLFDHSNGHDRLRPDGLSTTTISKSYGGKQPSMRDSLILDSHLGPFINHPSIQTLSLTSGVLQAMTFSEDDVGPWFLSSQERESKKRDINTGKYKEIKLKKEELILNLKNQGILDPQGQVGLLQKQCVNLNLPIKKNIEIIKEG